MKTILVTGASGGLGIELSKKLLEEKYFVIMHYFKHKEKVETIHKSYPNQSMIVGCNIMEEKEIVRLKKELQEKNIQIDILINNAGIDHVSEIEEKTEETFLDVYKVNTLGPFYFLKHFGEELNQKHGNIINISSDNAIDKYDIVTIEYDLSKIALNRLTEIFAHYYQNIKINAICFGWLDTKMNNIPENIKKEMDFVPLDIAVESILKLLETKETGKIEIVR